MNGYAGGQSCDLVQAYLKQQLLDICPRTVVDFGSGAGKMGEICREVLSDKVHLTAVECFGPTVEILKGKGTYDTVCHSLLEDWLDANRERSDVAIFGDVLEHLTVRQLHRTVAKAVKQFDQVLINVPLRNVRQGSVGGNDNEEHLAFVTEEDFLRRYEFRQMHIIEPSPGFSMMNIWIVGMRRVTWKNSCKHWLLRHLGRRGVRLLAMFGFDAYVQR